MGILDDIKAGFRTGNNLTKLIYINIALFIIIAVIGVVGVLLKNSDITYETIRFLSVPSSLPVLLVRPWTLITYMFTQNFPGIS
jgi:membrane associated rhomboid family serine protease